MSAITRQPHNQPPLRAAPLADHASWKAASAPDGGTLIALVPSRERLPGTPVGAPVTAPAPVAAPSAPAPGGAKGAPGGAGLSGPPAGGAGGAMVGPGGPQSWLDRIMNDSPGMRLQQRGSEIESPHGSFVRAKVQSEWPFEGRTNRNGEIWVDARGRVTVPDNDLLDALDRVTRLDQGQPLDAKEIKAHNDYVSRHVRPNGDVFRMPSNPLSGGLVGAVGDYAVAALRFIPESAASPARNPAPNPTPTTMQRPTAPAQPLGPANDAGIAAQAAQVRESVRARNEQQNFASANNPLPTLPGVEAVVGNYDRDQVVEVVRDHNGRTDRNPHDIAVPVTVMRNYGTDGTRNEQGYFRGSAMNIFDQVDAMKRQGLIPRAFDLAGAARQVGVDWNSAVKAEADARAYGVAVDNPITLAGNQTYVFETAGEAQQRTIDYNRGSSGADYIAVPFQINREISTGKSSATGVSHEVWVGSPDQFADFYATMQSQGRIADGASAQTLLQRAGIPGSMPGRVEAAKALNAPISQEQIATPELPSLPPQVGGAQQAERRNNDVREAGERAGETLKELQRAASQPFSKGIDELVKDKADEMRGKGKELDALMLEMTHHSASAPGNAVGAHGGSRSAPGISSAALNKLRRLDPEKTAALVNGPLNGKLDRFPAEVHDAMRQSLQRAEQPSEAITAALRKLDPNADAAEMVQAPAAEGGRTDALSRVVEPPSMENMTVVKRPPAAPVAPSVDLPSMRTAVRIVEHVEGNWPADIEEMPRAQRMRMINILDLALDGGLGNVELDRDRFIAAKEALGDRVAYPNPSDALATTRWVNSEWSEAVGEIAPQDVRNEMAQTLDRALRNDPPELAFEQGEMRKALNSLLATGARAFPSPGDTSFGLGGPAVMPKSEAFGLPDGFEYVGPDVAGNPVFENANGDLVGPFSQKAATLADAAGPPLPQLKMTPLETVEKYVDVRAGISLNLVEPLSREPWLRAGATVSPRTFKDMFAKPVESGDATAGELESADELGGRDKLEGTDKLDGTDTEVEATEKKRPEWIENLTTRLGLGARFFEVGHDPRLVSKTIGQLFGVRGIGFNSALQFKVDSLKSEAAKTLTGADSAFLFNLAPRDGIDTSEPGFARIRGNLSLNVSEVPTQMDAFGSEKGRKFKLNEDLAIDKTMRELYLPKLSIGPLNTPSGELRQESNAKIVIPKGTILPKEFVDIINYRVGDSLLELKVPAPIADTPLTQKAVANEIADGLVNRNSFMADIDPADIEVNRIGGTMARFSAVPGKALPAEPNVLDANFRPLDDAVHKGVAVVFERLGIDAPNLPFTRSIPGTFDPANAILGNKLNGRNVKTRVKIDTPLSARIPNLASVAVAVYGITQAQPDMRTSMMRSNKQATLSFNDTMGNSREVAVPVWLASLVASSDKSGRFEASLGMAKFPDGGIVVPPGGTEGLRGFLTEQWKTGTDTDKQEIAEFLNGYMSGSKAKISDNNTLMPADRDKLIELLYRIADPAQRLPEAK